MTFWTTFDLGMHCQSEIKRKMYMMYVWSWVHYEKNGCFAIGFAIQFLSCIGHLQFIIFIHCECYRTSCKSCRLQFTIYTVQLIITQLQFCHNNSFSTTMQLPYDYNHNVMMISFSSIHQNLTHGIMKIFCDFFEILISIVHYDYLF